MRAWAGALAGLAVALVVSGATASPRADPVFSPSTLDKAKVGRPYKRVGFSGGQYAWSQEPCPGDKGDLAKCRAMIPKGMELRVFNNGADDVGYLLEGTPTEAGTFTLTFNFAFQGEKVTHSWTLVVEGAGTDLSVSVSGPEVLLPGDGASYALRVENNSGVDATDVRAKLDFPKRGLLLGRVKPSRGTCSKSSDLVACSFGTLKARASGHVDIVFRRDSTTSGPLELAASVSTATADSNAKNDTVVRVLRAGERPDVSIEIRGTKEIPWQRTRVDPGHEWIEIASARYDVYVTNHGPGPVTGISMTASWFDGKGKPLTIHTYVDDFYAFDCLPSKISGQAVHRTTCRLGSLRSGGTSSIRIHLFTASKDLEGPLGESESLRYALAKTGALVVRADVKVAEAERDGPASKDKNNRAEKVSTFVKVK